MFGEIFRGFKKAGIARKVYSVLMRNYTLQASPKLLNGYVFIKVEYITSNPHEIAVGYVAEQISMMDQDNAGHRRLATKYIRVAKQAYKVGAATNSWALDDLAQYAREKFGIDINNIEASPS